MTERSLRVAAAQMGPIGKDDSKPAVVDRLIALLNLASADNVELVVYPELTLTTFFPRWFVENENDLELESFFEISMPSPETEPLFLKAKELGIGFCLGYAELTEEGERYNTQILVDSLGGIVGKYRKVHLPGHEEYEPWRKFQHLERRYFQAGDSFPTWRAFGGIVGMAICNDRRWSETYRSLALAGAELILIGYNTPINYAPDPSQDKLASFHSRLVMQSGAYQNGCYVIGVAKGGMEEGIESLSDSCIIGPSGEILAEAETDGDELIIADIDLDICKNYKQTLFDFARYRRPEAYEAITNQTGAIPPEEL